MWILLAMMSAFLLGIYDVFKKKSLSDNAVIPVLSISIFFSFILFLPLLIASGLEGTKYASALTDAMPVYNETGSVAVFEKALDAYVSEYSKSLAVKKPLGVGPIIGYLSQKENEIKNLKIIARAKREADFPNSKIMEMLI